MYEPGRCRPAAGGGDGAVGGDDHAASAPGVTSSSRTRWRSRRGATRCIGERGRGWNRGGTDAGALRSPRGGGVGGWRGGEVLGGGVARKPGVNFRRRPGLARGPSRHHQPARGGLRPERHPARQAGAGGAGGARCWRGRCGCPTRSPASTSGARTWKGNPLVVQQGDIDGRCEPTGRGFLPVNWLGSPTALLPLWMLDEDGVPIWAIRGGRWRRSASAMRRSG